MELLRDSPKRTTSVQWPDAVDARLEILAALATAAGEQVSRAQLLAALVAMAPLDKEALSVAVHSYRQQLHEEFATATAQVEDLPRVRRSGRKRRNT
jgi:DNA-binding response OmpR family regulator